MDAARGPQNPGLTTGFEAVHALPKTFLHNAEAGVAGSSHLEGSGSLQLANLYNVCKDLAQERLLSAFPAGPPLTPAHFRPLFCTKRASLFLSL